MQDEFIPANGNRVLWYNCGPTVYDSAHMGHARSYIAFDIIRRILANYFRYDVFLCMNITDIDDKIIRRARQNHLFDQYSVKLKQELDGAINQKETIDQIGIKLKELISKVTIRLKSKLDTEQDPDKKIPLTKMLNQAQAVVSQFSELKNTEQLDSILTQVKDPLSDLLDDEHGHEVTDNEIFTTLPRHYESEFFNDMAALNVQPPDALTRVSEYVPEIVAFIEKIIANGYAYLSPSGSGSVYFDVDKFSNSDKHFYAKLVPEATGNLEALREGEGVLNSGDSVVSEKKNIFDFALWKNSKPGEPSWDSPWGRGRPGWHIECSVMATEVLGNTLDIHSGGCDLKFPHHDNEIAQSEAYFDTGSNWVNYFLHSGHLTISGCKMSKSLKNFISIKDCLKQTRPRTLRLAFLLHGWNSTLDYSENTMKDADSFEGSINNFFANLKSVIRDIEKTLSSNLSDRYVKWTKTDLVLNRSFLSAVDNIDTALCDNLDTRRVLEELKELITRCNVYMDPKTNSAPNLRLLENIAVYITQVLNMFGLSTESSHSTRIGWTDSVSENGVSDSLNREQVLLPVLDVLATFREQVRQSAKELKSSPLLQLCDQLRDEVLPELGVQLEDKEGGKFVIKLTPKEQILAERDAKRKAKDVEAEEKRRKAEERQRQEAEKESQARIPPSQLFISQTDKYSKFDEKVSLSSTSLLPLHFLNESFPIFSFAGIANSRCDGRGVAQVSNQEVEQALRDSGEKV